MSILFSVSFLVSVSLQGQNGVIQTGAKPESLGNSYTAIFDSWSIFHNPAGVAETKNTTGLFSYANKFNVEGLNTLSAAFLKDLGKGKLGLSVFRFGDQLFSEQALSGTYSHSIGITSLGIRVNYFEYSSEISRTRPLITIDFGGISRLTENLNFGAYIRNINQAKLTNVPTAAPIILNVGFSYLPTEKLVINAEVEKDIDFDPGFRMGLEYGFLPKFKSRVGILTEPFTNYFGLGFNTTKLTIDYALTRNNVLGYSHQTSLSYFFNKR